MDYWLSVTSTLMVYITLGTSLNWLLGYGGMFSIAHGAVLGVGAYTFGISENSLGLPPLLGTVAAVAVATAVGAVLGAVAVRVSGTFLIITSFGVQVLLIDVFVNGGDLTGGAYGFAVDRPLAIPGLATATSGLVIASALAIASVVGTALLALRSRRWLIVRGLASDPIAVEAGGHSVARTNVFLHCGSFALAGLGGVVFASAVGYASPEDFNLNASILIMTVMAVGGSGHYFGPVIGGVIAVGIPEALTFVSLPPAYTGPIQEIVYGALLVIFMLVRPKGILNPDSRIRPATEATHV